MSLSLTSGRSGLEIEVFFKNMHKTHVQIGSSVQTHSVVMVLYELF